ncbi:LysR family transcriptional regulator [Nocardioides lijunqiniae]|uniref:LysR family transcriptional regulator n=1 Tax=Nocardioides lijunqiniae TaxID=2760832 RepID=UPI001D0C32DC|nr:LysR family transcriptional regulator [Nocardioides lijunqiniae]
MPVLSLHQLRCFLATYEHGSLTAAAEELGYAQPSVSEQIRGLEQTLGVQLFRRVGRGVIPTTVADTLRPHAEQTLAAAEDTRLAAQQVRRIETGTIRFGMFGVARLYAGADLVADVLERHPGVRVELIGQNSSEVHEDLRRGRLEAAMIAMPGVTSEGMEVRPVARDEVVYASADPTHLERPMTVRRLAEASLVMPETTWRTDDSVRTLLRQALQGTGLSLQTRIEVEDPEIAVELMGRGYGDTVLPKGAAEVLLPRLAPHAGFVSLRPRLYDYFAVVHRAGARLSPAAELMIELATARIQRIAEPV